MKRQNLCGMSCYLSCLGVGEVPQGTGVVVYSAETKCMLYAEHCRISRQNVPDGRPLQPLGREDFKLGISLSCPARRALFFRAKTRL
ncbi:uncharacterized protein SCHCODRAFT_02625111 [Schizophyllum commune H4-8]|uniref:uncharacterized protein n=1 Tax=Schizophyllum commune (strain H4-8 / FGSC 9210) TaxID=578458 RepID=UPI00215E0377|nr:uncharacterized protein SCHCODRAFT_02625111 [Schizophyllum commune H4-8]KAI5892039.1 hypothetical protein SCHCODRAFT_02625111 [Schizophyllum commune H4-8]